jgi:uncharacterized protein YcsI (UPF0317 family)
MVVSMRPVPAPLVAFEVSLSARMPAVHGAPVHIGDPGSLLAGDIAAPEFGDPVQFVPETFPCSWHAG